MSKLKILYFVIPISILIVIGFFTYSHFIKNVAKFDHPLDAIPDNYAMVFEIETIDKLEKIINSDTGFIPYFVYNYKSNTHITSLLKQFKKISSENQAIKSIWFDSKAYISIHFMGIDKFENLFTFQLKDFIELKELNLALSKFGKITEIKIDGTEILKYNDSESEEEYYITINKGLLLICKSNLLMQKVVQQIKKGIKSSNNTLMQRTIKLSGQSEMSLIVNHSFYYRFISQFAPDYRDEIKSLRNFAGMSEFDIKIDKNLLLLSGYSLFEDTSNTMAKLLTQNPSIEPTQFNILPANTSYLFFQGSQNFGQYYTDMTTFKNFDLTIQKKLESDFSFTIKDNILSWIKNEVSYCITSNNEESNAYAILTTTDQKEALQQLDKIASTSFLATNQLYDSNSYRGYPINFINIKNFIPIIFGKYFSNLENTFYISLENHIIFASSKMALQQFIDSYLIGQTITKQEKFSSINKYRSSKLNQYHFIDLTNSNQLINKYLSNNIDTLLSEIQINRAGLSFISLEVSSERNGVYTSIIAGSKNTNSTNDKMLTGWQIALDDEVLQPPFVYKNHVDGKTELLVFDKSNHLYRIDEKGKIVWKLPIAEKPISKISQIDFYKNEKYQYIFNTSNYLFIIDINGNRVENYPYKFPKPALGEISVLDYDNTKDYRILVPLSDEKLHNFMLVQESTPGWQEPEFKSNNILPIKHYRLNGKDFLLIADSLGNVIFANRRGEARIEAKLAFTNNPKTAFYKLGNKIITTDLTGRLIEIDAEGNVNKTIFQEFSSTHSFCITDYNDDGQQDYVYYDKNSLKIYSNTKELLFDTLLSNTYLTNIQPISNSTHSSYRLVMLNQLDNTIYLLDKKLGLISKKELGITNSFLIDNATKNNILRLMTVNNRVVSNFLIK